MPLNVFQGHFDFLKNYQYLFNCIIDFPKNEHCYLFQKKYCN